MYVQYKGNVSENQVDTMKDAIRLRKAVTLCFPKGSIRGDQVGWRHAQIRMSGKECKLYWRFYRYAGITRSSCFSTILTGLTTGLPLVALTKRLAAVVMEMDSFYTNMVNAIEYRNIKVMVSI